MKYLRFVLRTLLPFAFGSCLFGVAGGTAATATFKRGVNIDNWLSQNDESMPYAADWFQEEDVAWIAAQGFDHLRVPVDPRLWFRPDDTLDETKVEPFDRTLAWCRRHGLGVILDAHFLAGADFNGGPASDIRAYTDSALQERNARWWRVLARRYANEGPWLRFEILNEPKAEKNSELNAFALKMLAAIRESNPTRVVYFPVNKWNTIPNIGDAMPPEDDRNVIVTVHFYEPTVFTHQKAPWVYPGGEAMPAVHFPGKVPELGAVAAQMPSEVVKAYPAGQELSVAEYIEGKFAPLEEWLRTKGKGREIYLGEFGVFHKVDAASTIAWTRAVRQLCERQGYGWAVWGYRSVFPVRTKDGKPAPMLEGLFKN